MRACVLSLLYRNARKRTNGGDVVFSRAGGGGAREIYDQAPPLSGGVFFSRRSTAWPKGVQLFSSLNK